MIKDEGSPPRRTLCVENCSLSPVLAHTFHRLSPANRTGILPTSKDPVDLGDRSLDVPREELSTILLRDGEIVDIETESRPFTRYRVTDVAWAIGLDGSAVRVMMTEQDGGATVEA